MEYIIILCKFPFLLPSFEQVSQMFAPGMPLRHRRSRTILLK